MSRPSSRQSAHSAASLRSAGSFSPVRASSGFGAPICGRPGTSIAQYDPWLKPEWRPPLNSFKYGSAEPVRMSERLIAVGDEPSKQIGVRELWERVDTDELAEAEHRVRLLSATWQSDPSTRALSMHGASPEVSGTWSFGQEPTIGMYDKRAAVSTFQSAPSVRTGAFRASRSIPRSFAAAAGRKHRGSSDPPGAASPVASCTGVAASTGPVYRTDAQARVASWLTTEQRAWLAAPSMLSRPSTAGSVGSATKRVGERREQRRQQQLRVASRREPARTAGAAVARNRVGHQHRSRARAAEQAGNGISPVEQWRLSL